MTEILPFNQRITAPSFNGPGGRVSGESGPPVQEDSVDISPDASSLADKKICIDPGHGGGDSGAVGPSGYTEKEANLEISKYLKNYLEGKGAQVVMTRTEDVSLTPSVSGKDELKARVDVANNSEADVFISVHNNSSSNPAAQRQLSRELLCDQVHQYAGSPYRIGLHQQPCGRREAEGSHVPEDRGGGHRRRRGVILYRFERPWN